jgi:hypothetical protein
MRCRIRVATAVILLTVVSAVRADDTEIISTFDVDLERWRAEGGELAHRALDDDGGYIEITDTASRHSMAVVSPERFVGKGQEPKTSSRSDGVERNIRFESRRLALIYQWPGSIQYITQDHLQEWGVTFAKAVEAARSNLAQRQRPFEPSTRTR